MTSEAAKTNGRKPLDIGNGDDEEGDLKLSAATEAAIKGDLKASVFLYDHLFTAAL